MKTRTRALTVFASVAIALSAGAAPAAAWLHQGPSVRYPSAGGTWQYGFWDAKVRSYYTVNRCHGSTVELNGQQSRSINTAAGKKSIADKFAVQQPSHVDKYFYRTC